ncbi:MAG: helicase HerA-like domain-containing protein [Phascolarctobacterium sp.]
MYIPKLHKIWLCQNSQGGIYLTPKMANRHGLIAGATGTGKTVTLKVMAESFSEMGVPVFLADIKGDVSGMILPGEDSEGFQKRIKNKLGLDIDWKFAGYPVRFWDVYGKMGLPVRTTISDMGPELLSRLLELNDTQSGVMNIIFRVADSQGLLLLDFKDLRSMVQYVGDHAAEIKMEYGNVSSQSIGAIQRALLRLEDQGGNIFFGEPALDIKDWFATDSEGRGIINLLHCTELFQNPLLYSTFLLWMLSELYEMMPEAGDLNKPKMVFFFDEAHLIFKDAPRSLLDKVEQIVRLIRSKGIGIYFITQQPADIPDTVLSQLGNKLQHALRAYTPKERKGLKAAAQAFRPNPDLNAEAALGELGTGEVLVSLLDEEGVPTMVQRAYVMPPRSYLGTCSDEVRRKAIQETPLYTKYQETIDRESAYEILQKRALEAAAGENEEEHEEEQGSSLRDEIRRNVPKSTARSASSRSSSTRGTRAAKEPPSVIEKVATSALQTFGRTIANSLARGLLGSLLKK